MAESKGRLQLVDIINDIMEETYTEIKLTKPKRLVVTEAIISMVAPSILVTFVEGMIQQEKYARRANLKATAMWLMGEDTGDFDMMLINPNETKNENKGAEENKDKIGTKFLQHDAGYL